MTSSEGKYGQRKVADVIAATSKNVSEIASEAQKLSEGVNDAKKGLQTFSEDVMDLPGDVHGKRAKEELLIFNRKADILDSRKEKLTKACNALASRWCELNELVRKAKEPLSVDVLTEIVKRMKGILKLCDDCNSNYVEFQELLNTASESCKNAEVACEEGEKKAKSDESEAVIIGGLCTGLALGTTVAATVVTLGAATPLAAAATAGAMGTGTAVVGGVTIALSVKYSGAAEKFRRSKNEFRTCSSKLFQIGNNIIALQRSTREMIDNLKEGRKLQKDHLEKSRKLAEKSRKLAEYEKRFGPLD